jgi:cytidine deaminase
MSFDWERLQRYALGASYRAYAPYSNFKVGAAGVVNGEFVVEGCNIESASYGLTLCAECSMISDYYRVGEGPLTHVVVVNSAGEVLMPCGRCRQLLWEHGGPTMLLLTPSGPKPMSEVLPDAFDATDLG